MTLTKEWLQKTIAELEEERDSMPGVVNVDAAMALAAMKIALASLEAEAVTINDDMAYAFHHALSDSSLGADEVEEIKSGLRAAFANITAPPAPVFVPDLKPVGFLFVSDDGAVAYSPADWPMKGFNLIGQIYGDLNACRAAMLQGADGNSPAIPDGWTGSDEANAALIMLDRIETVDSVDDDRIDGIKRIIRALAAAPKQEVK